MRLPSPSRAVSSGAGRAVKSRALLRLCAWGTAAALAFAVAVAAGRTELGAKRAHAALEAILSDPASPENQAAERLTAWSHAVEAEMRRQAEIVRALAADHEGVARKFAAMDGRIGELAGTLARTTTRLEDEAKTAQQSAALAVASLAAAGQGRGDPPDPAAPSVPNAAAPASVSGPAGTASLAPAAAAAAAAHGPKDGLRSPAGSAPPGQIRAPGPMSAVPQVPIASSVASAGPDGAPAYTGAIPMPAATEAVAGAAHPPAAAVQAPFSNAAPAVDPTVGPVPLPRPNTARAPAAAPESPVAAPFPANPLMTAGIFGTPVEPGEIATAFAIDLGSAGTIEAARTRWKALVTSQSPLLDNLKPLITVKDGGKSGQELHLIAGPLNSMAGSVRLCAVLASSAPCQPTAFEGQRLSVR